MHRFLSFAFVKVNLPAVVGLAIGLGGRVGLGALVVGFGGDARNCQHKLIVLSPLHHLQGNKVKISTYLHILHTVASHSSSLLDSSGDQAHISVISSLSHHSVDMRCSRRSH